MKKLLIKFIGFAVNFSGRDKIDIAGITGNECEDIIMVFIISDVLLSAHTDSEAVSISLLGTNGFGRCFNLDPNYSSF